ncbi:MAG: 6-carboxyhexanoate--CoA ligase [Nitrospirae bacterium]|nr:MAG: 6-carboxyhexanoate--CoA ligase [Nitrospirota bacterium]
MKQNLFSVRMRASRKTGQGKAAKQPEVHISGAEGLYPGTEVSDAAGSYLDRAMRHSRGKPDRIVITVEKVSDRPNPLRSLPVRTLLCDSPATARKLMKDLLAVCGISPDAVRKALKLLYAAEPKRGASLVCSVSGKRVEPDRDRGVRASRIGISRQADRALSAGLTKHGLDTETVKEALVLASKVSACNGVLAEVCISDDPGYTTGYLSSRDLGYVRIPNIKAGRSGKGGRVFFVREDADISAIVAYLEKTPVIVTRTSPCSGTSSADELLDRYNR